MTLSYKQVGSAMTVMVVASLTLFAVITPGATERTTAYLKLKQLGLAGLAYSEDHDNLLPLSFGPNLETGQGHRYSSLIRVPAGWPQNDSAVKKAENSLAWPNSMRPYYKDKSALEVPGVPIRRLGFVYDSPKEPWQNVGLTFNGMLHSWPTHAIGMPSRLTLFWQGIGNQNGAGGVISNPVLKCDIAGLCRYNPAGKPQASSDTEYPWAWWSLNSTTVADNHSVLMLSADLSVTARPTRRWEWNFENHYTGASVNDYAGSYKKGHAYWMRECRIPDSITTYPCYFKPDYDFKEVGGA